MKAVIRPIAQDDILRQFRIVWFIRNNRRGANLTPAELAAGDDAFRRDSLSSENRYLRRGWRARSHLQNQGEATTAQYIMGVHFGRSAAGGVPLACIILAALRVSAMSFTWG